MIGGYSFEPLHPAAVLGGGRVIIFVVRQSKPGFVRVALPPE